MEKKIEILIGIETIVLFLVIVILLCSQKL